MKIGIKLLLGVLMISLPLSGLASIKITKPLSYKLKVRIEPEKGEVFVNGVISILLKDEKDKGFSFDIHDTFTLENLLLNGKVVNYSAENNEPSLIQPASKKVTVKLPADIMQRRVKMIIDYHGKLRDIPEFGASEDQKLALDDRINCRIVELACYSCWYPFFEYGIKFDIDLEVSFPIPWKCVCSGKRIEGRKTDKRIVDRWIAEKDIDIVIVASPELKHRTVKASAGEVDIFFTLLREKFINQEAKEIEETLILFSELLGKPNISGASIKHVYSPKRKGQGGISRTGMIITSEGRTLEALSKDPDLSFLHGNAHEMSHFWWNFGFDQGDWINETFAEYFSLIALRDVSSNEEFEACLKKYKKYVAELPEDAPSLSKVPPVNDEIGYVVRYFKGSLMLESLRKRLGDKVFFEICHRFYDEFNKKLIGTEEFRNFWGERLAEHKRILEIWLDSKGGLPELDDLK